MDEYNRILIRTIKKIRNQDDDYSKIELLYPKPEILKNLSELIETYIPYISIPESINCSYPLTER